VSDRREPADVPTRLLDLEQLGRWLDERGLEPGAPIDVDPLPGGASNVMFVVRRGDSRWVLRRPSAVAIERANDGMRREFRFLRALAGTGVPHPSVVALCEDHDVLGCTFFLMEAVVGVHPDELADRSGGSARSEIAFALVDALAGLHGVDWRTADLGDLGRPDGFHERQVERWTRQLTSYEGRKLPGIGDVAAWLDEHRPDAFEPGIMHGDFHVRNTLMHPDLPARVMAILDWETATIGDPLLDLAGFCELLAAHGKGTWPAAADLVERYCATRGFAEEPDLRYHAALHNFRLAVLLEGIHQRSLRDPTRPDQHAVGAVAVQAVARAVAIVEGAGHTE
jgi:aminoglycoside phosphotransferase (APT) family kinase protein